MGSLDHLWAGWRAAYVGVASTEPEQGGSLFERVLAVESDDDAYVVHRGRRCSTLLNLYPYTSGHLLAMPNRAVRSLGDLDDLEHAELWDEVRDAVAAIEAAYAPEGVNVGMNLGRAGGAGVPDHLHVHVLPRWAADTNFMTAVAGTRVLPEPLSDTWRRVRDAWPR